METFKISELELEVLKSLERVWVMSTTLKNGDYETFLKETIQSLNLIQKNGKYGSIKSNTGIKFRSRYSDSSYIISTDNINS